MDIKTYKTVFNDCLNALNDHRLTDALACIESMLYLDTETPDLAELNSLKADYRMMLDFMSQGGKDPQRETVLQKIVRRIEVLNEKVFRQAEIKYSQEMHATIMRRMANDSFMGQPIALLQEQATLLPGITRTLSQNADSLCDEERTLLQNIYEGEGERLFNLLFTCPYLNPDEVDPLVASIESQPEPIAALMVSALFLNLWLRLDENLMRVIELLCESGRPQVRCRALCSLVLCCAKYEFQRNGEPDDILERLKRTPHIRKELIQIQKQCFISMETTQADRKMREDIIPTLSKSNSFYRHSMGFEDIDPNNLDITPPDPKDCEALERHMQDFMKMNAEGIDINLSTFTPLKKIPFFQKAANWFWPFDELRPEVSALWHGKDGQTKTNLRLLLHKSGYCDSDCYSFIHMFKQMAPEHRDSLLSQLANSLTDDELTAMQQTEREKSRQPATLIKHYFEDIYRFMKLHPQRKDFEDVFEFPTFYLDSHTLEQMMKEPDYLHEIGDFLTAHKYYSEADSCWKYLLDFETNAEILGKAGYCLLQKDSPRDALEKFLLAEVIEPDNPWLCNQIRHCYAQIGRTDKELEYLLKAEARNPEDTNALQETGLCLMRMGRFEEALTRFYKLEFMEVKVWAVSRAIAWCQLRQGKLDKADRYYTRIISHGKAKWEDYLNAGHTAWLKEDVKRAIGLYRQYMELYEKKKTDDSIPTIHPFVSDTNILKELGKDDTDLLLMTEYLEFNS